MNIRMLSGLMLPMLLLLSGCTGGDGGPSGIREGAISSSGPVYVANSGSNNVTAFTIGTGGVLTLVPSTGGNPNPVTVGTTPKGIAVPGRP